MTTFANIADAGDQLAPLLSELPADSLLVPIMPSGIAVACRVAKKTHFEVGAAFVERGNGGVEIVELPKVVGRTTVIVDDGVETGTAVRAVVEAVRSAGAARVVVAMPVLPREVEAWLAPMVDEVIAIDRPLARRALSWHYEVFEPLDDELGRFILSREAWKRGQEIQCVPPPEEIA